jgi:hypothetical protein
MSYAPPGECRYCHCTEVDPCTLSDGDTCSWANRERNVCTGDKCMRAYLAAGRKAKANRPRKKSTAEVHALICGKRRKKKAA